MRAWLSSLVSGWADSAVSAEITDCRSRIGELETELEKAQRQNDALQSQVEMMMHAHEVNLNLLNRMNATHGFHATKQA